MGGIDLCFGRWDTPQHALIDDPEDGVDAQIWPGALSPPLTASLNWF